MNTQSHSDVTVPCVQRECTPLQRVVRIIPDSFSSIASACLACSALAAAGPRIAWVLHKKKPWAASYKMNGEQHDRNSNADVKSENGAGPSTKNDVDYELPDLPEAPVFYPTAEEFQDPMKYLESIRAQAEPAGVIKIVPPKEWRCPFPIKENGDSFHFQTCVQSVDQVSKMLIKGR